MSKAILIMDMPDSCMECPLLDGKDECIMQNEDRNAFADTFDKLREGCPLRKLPEKRPEKILYKLGICATAASFRKSDLNIGWNACIDAIEGSEANE